MVSFLKDTKDIKVYTSKPTTFYDAEIFTVYWETKKDVVKSLLPPPLEPADRPIVSAFIANYPKTNFSPAYKEAALFILSKFNGQLGTYCLSMPITDGMAMALGREIYGFPKKMAQIELKKEEDNIYGSVARNGIEFFRIKAKLNGKPNDENGDKIISKNYGAGLPIFNIKYSKSPDGSGYDLKPLLVKQGATIGTKLFKQGNFEITLKDSVHDPWSELEVVNMLGCTYTEGTSILLRGEVLAEVDPVQYIPYSYTKWDWWEENLNE